MNKNPLVYIVLPVYNWEKYFLEQLMSIYYQNYKNWYLIIVNDWSTDNSENIARDWISHYNLYDKVKVINKENGWVNTAVQRWLEEVKTIWDINNDNLVAYCDSDDIRTRQKLEIQVWYMIKHPECGLSYCDCNIINENWLLMKHSYLKNYVYCDKSFLFLSCYGTAVVSTEMMFYSKYIEKILPFPTGFWMYQDYWTELVFSLLNINSWYIDKALCYYRKWHDSLMKVQSKSEISEQKHARIRYIEELQYRFPNINLSYYISYLNDRLFVRNEKKYPSLWIHILMLIKYPRLFHIWLKLFLWDFFKKFSK